MNDSRHLAFVAGATGYTGRAVVDALCAQGIDTIAHVRPNSPSRDDHQARFEALGAQLDFTPWDPEGIAASLKAHQPTLVFCLLGTTRRRVAEERRAGGPGLTYQAVDYGMTMMVVRGAEALSNPPRVIYLSAAGVKPSRPGSYYHARWQVEEALKASSLPWTIAQPYFITGSDREERRPAERMAGIVFDGLLCLGGARARRRWSSLTAPELARGLVRHALDPNGASRVVAAADLRDTV